MVRLPLHQLVKLQLPMRISVIQNVTNDLDIKKDAELLDKFQQIMTDNNTSKWLIFYISQFGTTYQKARCSIKKRTETKASTNPEALTLRGLNTEIYGVNNSIQSEYSKIRTRNDSVFGHFSRSVSEQDRIEVSLEEPL